MIDCNVIQDLIPLVNDNVASEASKLFVEKHCQECPQCKGMVQPISLESPPADDKKILNNIKRNLNYTKVLFIGIGVLAAIFFLGLNRMFLLNVFAIPALCAIPIILKKTKWLIVPSGIIIWTIINNVINYFNTSIPYRPQVSTLFNDTTTIMYIILFGLGLGAGFLIKFALKKEVVSYEKTAH